MLNDDGTTNLGVHSFKVFGRIFFLGSVFIGFVRQQKTYVAAECCTLLWQIGGGKILARHLPTSVGDRNMTFNNRCY